MGVWNSNSEKNTMFRKWQKTKKMIKNIKLNFYVCLLGLFMNLIWIRFHPFSNFESDSSENQKQSEKTICFAFVLLKMVSKHSISK